MTKRSLMSSILAVPLIFLIYTSQAAGGWLEAARLPERVQGIGQELAAAFEGVRSEYPATIAGRPPVEADESEMAGPPEPLTHIVQPGETLHSIAVQYGVTVEALARANDIPNANRIWAGQMLIIPATGSVPSAKDDSPSTGLLPGDRFTMYTVQPGDTMNGLATRFGISVEQLASQNDIANPNRLYAGQVLAIPSELLDSSLLVVSNPAPVASTAASTAVTPATAVVAAAPAKTVAAWASPDDQLYVVVSGDTLSAIAFYYETTVRILAAANNLADPDFLYVGQNLVVSGPTLAEAAQKLAMGGLSTPDAGDTVQTDQAEDTTLR